MLLRNAMAPLMGGLMGLMILRMAHGAMTGDSTIGGTAIGLFVLTHLAVILGGGLLAFWATRFAPGLRKWIGRMHRPSARHVILMVGSAGLTMAVTHLVLHGGL